MTTHDPALNNEDLDKAANEVMGYMGDQGDAPMYGPPKDDSMDHNSSWMDSSAFGPVR